jgi:hypothetical protein
MTDQQETQSSLSNAQTQEQLDTQSAKQAGGGSPDFVKVYKLEAIGSQRTFRVVYGDDYASEADRISVSGRTVQPGSHVIILAPGAETRVFGEQGIPEPTDTMRASQAPFVDADLRTEQYIDPRPSPEVDPQRHPQIASKIRERQAKDEAIRVSRLESGEAFRDETPDAKQTRLERENAEHTASLRKMTEGKSQPAQSGAQTDRDRKAQAMRQQLSGQAGPQNQMV